MGFKSFSDPKDGDLLYGLKGPRRQYKADKSFAGKSILIIDQFKVIPDDSNRSIADTAAPEELLVKYYLRHPEFNDNAETRGKCKAGIGWAVEDNRVVHFVLDGIDMDNVVDKQNDSESRRCTNSELRWIYRNRFQQKIVDGVQFWFQRKQVSPPWVSNCTYSTEFGPTGLVMNPIDTVNKWKKYLPKNVPGLIAPP